MKAGEIRQRGTRRGAAGCSAQSLAEARADAEIASAQRVGLAPQLAAPAAERDAAAARASSVPARQRAAPSPAACRACRNGCLRARGAGARELPARVRRAARRAGRARDRGRLQRAAGGARPPRRARRASTTPRTHRRRRDRLRPRRPRRRAALPVVGRRSKTDRPLPARGRRRRQRRGRRPRTSSAVAAAEPRVQLDREPRPAARLHDRRQPRAARRDRRLRRPAQQRHDRHAAAGSSGSSTAASPTRRSASSARSRTPPATSRCPSCATHGGWATNPLPSFATPDGDGRAARPRSRRASARASRSSTASATSIKRAVDRRDRLLRRGALRQRLLRGERLLRAARREAGFELARRRRRLRLPRQVAVLRRRRAREVLAKRNYADLPREARRASASSRWSQGLEASTRARRRCARRVSDALVERPTRSRPRSTAPARAAARRLRPAGARRGRLRRARTRSTRRCAGCARSGSTRGSRCAAKAIDRARARLRRRRRRLRALPTTTTSWRTITAGADVIVATHFKSRGARRRSCGERRDDFLPAYYVQDYEPFFSPSDSADVEEALASYTAHPGVPAVREDPLAVQRRRRAPRRARRQGRAEHRRAALPPERSAARPDGPVRVAAMVRPRTPRRQPAATVAVLERLSRERSATEVEVTTFGCRRRPSSSASPTTAAAAPATAACCAAARSPSCSAPADVFLDLSIYQAFGRTALEAMACGATAVVPAARRRVGVRRARRQRDRGRPVRAPAGGRRARGARRRPPAAERLQARARQTAARYSILRAALSEYLLFAESIGAGSATVAPVRSRVRRRPRARPCSQRARSKSACGVDDWGHEGHADERLQRFMRNALDDLIRPDHAP